MFFSTSCGVTLPDSTAGVPPTRAARIEYGRSRHAQVSRSVQGDLKLAKRGRDPLSLLAQTDTGRVPALVRIRYGRMAQSPFAFLRGSASVMAFDLAQSPVSGIRVQECGVCHLMNFGVFATRERHLIFDINDFDENLPAPWEWDIKRLAASIWVAGRYCQFAERHAISRRTLTGSAGAECSRSACAHCAS